MEKFKRDAVEGAKKEAADLKRLLAELESSEGSDPAVIANVKVQIIRAERFVADNEPTLAPPTA